ncbi:MAG: hypothetical protein K8W52_46825 [Deltaproteobacteria bacterium]|nr:hypothetical protein [Deltaproteobacteria bacterium]
MAVDWPGNAARDGPIGYAVLAVCQMLNVFVPARGIAIPPGVRQLELGLGGEIHRGLAAHYAGVVGTMLVAQGRCLCGFADWPAVVEVARELATRNAVDRVAILSFWPGDRGPLTERVFDIDDDAAHEGIAAGELVVLDHGTVEQRRYRRLLRALSGAVGREVTLQLKSHATLAGVLAFDPESEVGSIGDRTFVAAQVHALVEVADAGC